MEKYEIKKEDIKEAFNWCLQKLEGWEAFDVPLPPKQIRLAEDLFASSDSLGRCHTIFPQGEPENRECTIHINRAFLSGYMSPECLKSTMMHEFVHTLDNCNNHGAQFQLWEKRINEAFGLDLGTRATIPEAKEFLRGNVPLAKDLVVCVDCGHYRPFVRKTKKIVGRDGRFIPNFRCNCGEHSNCLVLRRAGRDLISPQNARKSDWARADKWLRRHVPPESYLKGKPFHWTPERIEKEFWWLENSSTAPAKTHSEDSEYIQLSLF
jgi:hypothetical protein